MLNQVLQLFSDKKRIETSRKKLFQAAFSWCHDVALSDDLTQQTIVKALASKSTLKNPKYLDTWLFRILLNTWHDYLRQHKAAENLENFVFASISDVEQDYLRGELIARVRHEISKLPVALREVITLSDFSGFSYQQIADIMSIPVGTVMSRLYRARRVLEKTLLDVKPEQSSVTYLRKAK